MKKFITRSVTTLALVSMLGVAVPAVAFAGSVKSSTDSSTSISAKGHEALMDAYRAKALVIRTAFRASVAAAKFSLKTALATATTSSDRNTAHAAFRTKIAMAVSVRRLAFKNLGALPVK